jgi:hypothetical protein
MNKRSHVIGSIQTLVCAVLMISFLVLVGCPTDGGDDGPGTIPEEEQPSPSPGPGPSPTPPPATLPQPDRAVDISGDDTALAAALLDPSLNVIEVTGTGTLSTVTEIPAGKTVILRDAVTLSAGLTVEGTVYVSLGGTLTAESGKEVTVISDGIIEVRKSGTLSVDGVGSVTSGVDTALGTDAVVINGGTLAFGGTVTTVDAIKTVFGYVTAGALDLGTVTTAFKPSDIAGISGISADKALMVELTGDAAETVTPLTIPEGLDLTISGTLAAVASITVAEGGSFTAAAATFPVATSITINGNATFSAALVPLGDVTVGATGVLTMDSGSLTIAAAKTLTIAGIVNLGTASVKLTSGEGVGGAKITGTGKLTVGKTEITGAWQAVGTHASDVTIAATSPTVTTITAAAGEVFTAGTGAKITQLAVENNNLSIGAATVINLGGTGEIELISGAKPAKLTFTATSIIKVGAGTGGSAIDGLTDLAIGGEALINTDLKAADYQNAAGKLVQLGGTTAGNFTASIFDDHNVLINSTVAASGTA